MVWCLIPFRDGKRLGSGIILLQVKSPVGRRALSEVVWQGCGCGVLCDGCSVIKEALTPFISIQFLQVVDAQGKLQVRGENAAQLVHIDNVAVFAACASAAENAHDWTGSFTMQDGMMFTLQNHDRPNAVLCYKIGRQGVPIAFRIDGPGGPLSVKEAKKWERKCRRQLQSVPGTFVNSLDLSGRVWPITALRAIASFLGEIRETVVILKLDTVILGLETDDGLLSLSFLAKIFSSASRVKELCLNDTFLGNGGVQVWSPLLRNVERLYLLNTGIVSEDVRTLCATVDAAKLTTLAVGSTQMGVEAARHIEGLLLNCTTLMSFTYPNSRPQLAGTCHLCQGLAELSRTNHGLQHLNLQNCNLESQDDDAKSAVPWLAVFLKNSPHLKRLILRDCELTANGLKGILEAMVTSGAGLSVLDLGGNDRVGPAANNLGMFLSTQVITLRELIVDTCNLSVSGIACLLAPFTEHQSVLRSLNLDDNDIGFLAARVIVNTVICSLDTLSVKHNPNLPLEFALQLQKMYPKVKVDEDLQDEEQDLLIDEGHDLARAFGGLNLGA